MQTNRTFSLVLTVPIKLQSKLFSEAAVTLPNWHHPNQQANTYDWAYPGELPVPNDEAIKIGVKTALLLNCQLPEKTRFERSNKFDPTLPSGFTHTQHQMPLGSHGFFTWETPDFIRQRTTITSVGLTETQGDMQVSTEHIQLNLDACGCAQLEIKTDHSFKKAAEIQQFLLQIMIELTKQANLVVAEWQLDLVMWQQNSPEITITMIQNLEALNTIIGFIETENIKEQTPDFFTKNWTCKLNKTNTLYLQELPEMVCLNFPEPDIPDICLTQKFVHDIK